MLFLAAACQSPQPRQTTTDSAIVALQAFAGGKGSPLVMLGGGTIGAAGFAPHAQLLAKDFRVVRLQTLNIERSQKKEPLPPKYSVKIESNAMARSLDRLGIVEPVDLVGHSFGALVALDFALDHPERIRTLVLAEPPAYWIVSPEELRSDPQMREIYELARSFGPTDEPTDEQLIRFLAALGRRDIQPAARGQEGWERWELSRRALRGLSAVPNHTDDPKRLGHFARPVLIVTGTDTVPFHRRINDILAMSLARVERVELAGGHGAPYTARDEFIAELRAFLSRHR
jgi:pimeloyl-ACP methyl ester carboxylesterase